MIEGIFGWLGSAWAGHDRQIAFVSMVATTLSLAATIAIAVFVAKSSALSTSRAHQLAATTMELLRETRVESIRQGLREADDLPHAEMLMARGRELTADHRAERVDLEAVWAANPLVPLPRNLADLPDDLDEPEQARVLEAALKSIAHRQSKDLLLFRDAARTAVELTVLAERFAISTEPIVEMVGRNLAHPSASTHEMITDLFREEFESTRTVMLQQLPAYLGLARTGVALPLHGVVNLMAGASEVVALNAERLAWLPEACKDLVNGYRWLLILHAGKVAESDWEFAMTFEPADALAESVLAAGISARSASPGAHGRLIGPVTTALRRLVDSQHAVDDLNLRDLERGVELIAAAHGEGSAATRMRKHLADLLGQE